MQGCSSVAYYYCIFGMCQFTQMFFQFLYLRSTGNVVAGHYCCHCIYICLVNILPSVENFILSYRVFPPKIANSSIRGLPLVTFCLFTDSSYHIEERKTTMVLASIALLRYNKTVINPYLLFTERISSPYEFNTKRE